jgi:hypothetical protein
MGEKNKKRDPMPSPDATPEEIGEFWDTHSLADYWDETHEVEFKVNLKSRQNQTSDETEISDQNGTLVVEQCSSVQKKDLILSDEITPDIPATTEDTSNAAFDTATDLILDSTIPAPIRKNLFKALDRLGSALIDVPVGALERRSSEKRAESEARIKITEAVNAQIIQQIKVDPEFPQRASNTFAKKILREQYNLEKILGFATDILRKTKSDNSTNHDTSEPDKEQTTAPTNQGENINEGQTIDDDWFNVFEKEASQKSTEDMQRRFARVLAGEIEKPGSYSTRTIKILSEMDQTTASLFKKLCSVGIVLENPTNKQFIDFRVPSLGGNPGRNTLKKYGLPFSKLNILNEYGLVIPEYNSSVDYQVSIVDDNNRVLAPFRHQGRYWALRPEPGQKHNEEFRIRGLALSGVGRELLHIVDIEPMPEFTEDLKKFFAEQKLQMLAY